MANFDKHLPGTFCWPELSTSNWQQGKDFYIQLFDWGFDDQPIGEGIFYTMLQQDGLDIGAMYQMEAGQQESGMPSHWLNYIAVDNIDLMTEKAKNLNAEIICGPMSVGDAGKMSLMVEPGGAMFALWQGNEHPGARKLQEPGTMCWNELATRNAEISKTFYCDLFDWQVQEQDMQGMPYSLFFIKEQESPVAGMLTMTEEWPEEIPPHWMVYFAVTNCDEYIKKAKSLGANICVEATDVPGVGRFSVITDPQGAVFSIIQGETP